MRGSLDETETSIELACDPRMPGAASGGPAIVSQLNGPVPAAQSVKVSVTRLGDEIERQQLPFHDLVKIDIEGMELSARRGMSELLATRRPQLYLEMHGATSDERARKAKEILELLFQTGYKSIRHIESGTAITQPGDPTARTGHLFCAAS